MDAKDFDGVNKAAEEIARAVLASYEAAMHRMLTAQRRNAELAGSVFETGIETLRAQAAFNLRMAQDLTEKVREQSEAMGQMSRESADAYAGFLGSLSSYYREVSEEPEEHDG